MPIRMILLVLLAVTVPSVAIAQSEDEMAVQRCVWACLANSNGANDPEYHACVERNCNETLESKVSDKATVSDVQQRLKALGFDPGPADGVFGRKTRRAIKAFAAANGLKSGSRIDNALLEALQKAEQQ